MTTGYVSQADNSAACNRAGVASPCGRYHLVTDWQGKPVATLDNAGKVAGYVEYEPHGFTNRAYVAKTVVGPTAAPFNTVFPVVTTSTVGASTAISALNSEVVSGRALLFNTDLALINCPNPGQVLLNGTTALTQKGLPLKWAWTNWVQLTPTTPTTAPGGQPATVTARGDCSASPTVTPYYVEFRRSQKAVPHVFVPLRAPGQYFDEETDLFENWNRYYDPFKGVYLQPEPLLQPPGFVKSEAIGGFSSPVYAYARDNPVENVDPDGKQVKRQYRKDGTGSTAAEILHNEQRAAKARACASEAKSLLEECLSKTKCEQPPPLPVNPSLPDLRQRDEFVQNAMRERDSKCQKIARCSELACMEWFDNLNAVSPGREQLSFEACMRRE